MAIRQIVKHPDPVLRKKAKIVTVFNERLHTLLDDMAETMYHHDGVGLAANQVGVLRQVLVVDIGIGLTEIVNPKIIEHSGKQERPAEGCLSIPGQYGYVDRAYKIKIAGQTRHGQYFEMDAEGYLARALQHEIDHLNGILFIDIASRILTRKELEEERT